MPTEKPLVIEQKKSNKWKVLVIVLVVVILLLVLAVGILLYLNSQKLNSSESSQDQAENEGMETADETDTDDEIVVPESTPADHTKLPLGDNRYSTSPKKGYIYSCQTSFNGGGAFKQGPWIDTVNKTWDLTRKVTVDGQISWPTSNVTAITSGTKRVITSNGLPEHTTGIYPVKSTDDAYSYDRNPNSIKTQSLSYTLPLNPTLLNSPECAGGSVGIMLSGIPLYNGFDAGGRDAVATEIQDTCGGHPQMAGQYHYHGISDCATDNSDGGGHSGLTGYALDGFGIFGSNGEDGNELSTADLDECHGHTHEIVWDGETNEMFHYHLTYDFPYSVGCFRGKAVKPQ